MNQNDNYRYLSVSENFFSGFSPTFLLLALALLLLSGCSGLYASHPVADRNASDIDPRLEGLWQSVNQRDTYSWAVHFSDEDHVTGKLSLFRYAEDYSKTSKVNPTNVLSIRCIRRMNKGVCSAKLDGKPVPLLKEDMRGWNALDFHDTWTPSPKIRYVIARYEIQEDGTIAVYADANRDVLEQRIAEKGFASHKSNEGKLFVVTEPTPGLAKLLENANELFSSHATLVMKKRVGETIREKVDRLVGQLNKGHSKHRYDAALQLGQLGEQATDAVPALTHVIWDALESEQAMDFAVVRASVQALGRIGVASPDVLAALEALRVLDRKELNTAIGETMQTLKQKRENTPKSD